jgi:predicted amidohydrolase YtcJ
LILGFWFGQVTLMAHILYLNGPILSMDKNNSQPEAVLTQNDRIEAVGNERDLRGIMPADTIEHDLNNQCLIPAFIDPHGHFPDSGFIKLFRVDVSAPPRGDCPDIATVLHRIRDKVDHTPKGEWVMGVLFDNLTVREGRMPTKQELDQISQNHPIWILHASGHNGVANSYVLNHLGITRSTPDPYGGRYGRDKASGELNGIIEGLSAMGAMGGTDFLINQDDFWNGFQAACDEYLSYGVTMAQNSWVSRDFMKYFASLPADKDPGIDLILLPVGEEEPAMTTGDTAVSWPGNPHFKIGPRKLFTDGAFQLQTAYLSESYYQVLNEDTPCGMPYVDPMLHKSEVKRLHNLGYQIHCHCNGDAGADMFIHAVAEALAENPRSDHRHTIIHGQVLREDQLDRIAELGMTISFFSAHVYFWGDLHYSTMLGPNRASRISPAASAEKRGIRFTIHNDTAVTPTRPLHLAQCAVQRTSYQGRVLGEEQKISTLSAFRAMTIDAAWQIFEEDQRGSIENGKIADFAILNRNPLEASVDLNQIQVEKTIRHGKLCYDSSRAIKSGHGA